jgi:hypothetical protein
MIDFFLKKFWKYRKAFGLSYFYFGLSITYFLRDGIGLAPGNSVFTAVFTLGPLFLVFPTNGFKTYLRPNYLAYLTSFCFLAWSFFYFVFYCPNIGWFTNIPNTLVNYTMVLGIFVLLLTVNLAELRENFVPVCFVVCTLGCVFLIYYLARNPAYVVGMRAAVTVGTEENHTANPHIYARSAYGGVFSAILLLKHPLSSFKKLIVIGGGFVCLLILILAQSMSSILAFGLAMTLYVYFNSRLSSVIFKSYQMLWNWRFLLIIGTMLYMSSTIWAKYQGPITNISQTVGGRVERIFSTLIKSDKIQKEPAYLTTDLSAAERVEHINQVSTEIQANIENNEYFLLIFGNGFDKLYIDSPFIEVYYAFGIFGAFFYFSALWIFIKSVFSEMKNPRSDVTALIAYYFMLPFIQNLTSGSSADFQRWVIFALIARFLIPRKILLKKSTEKHQEIFS